MKYLRITLTALACAYFWYYAATHTQWHFIDNANLIFHEAGHAIFYFFGQFIAVAAGSGFQVGLPLFFALYFFLGRQSVSGALCLLWVGQNLLNISRYAGDAEVMRLERLGGEGTIHDWNYLLSTLGLLEHTAVVETVIFASGIAVLALGTTLALFYAWGQEVATTHPRYISRQ